MKLYLTVFAFLVIGTFFSTPCFGDGSFYDLSAKSITGETIPMSTYRGKVLLIVNTASQCGFTSQLGDLQRIYDEYKGRGLEVLGFPSNDFGNQEPLDNAGVMTFCHSKFGVNFPLFEKAHVSGKEKQAVYKYLTEDSPKEFNGDPGWNFVKFIVDRNGKVRDRFSSMTKPDSSSVTKKLEELLEEKAE